MLVDWHVDEDNNSEATGLCFGDPGHAILFSVHELGEIVCTLLINRFKCKVHRTGRGEDITQSVVLAKQFCVRFSSFCQQIEEGHLSSIMGFGCVVLHWEVI